MGRCLEAIELWEKGMEVKVEVEVGRKVVLKKVPRDNIILELAFL